MVTIFAILFILYEVKIFINAENMTYFKEFKFPSEQLEVALIIIINFLYSVWVIIGLFTTQWLWYLILIIMSFSTKNTPNKIRIGSALTILLLLMLLIDKFYFNIL